MTDNVQKCLDKYNPDTFISEIDDIRQGSGILSFSRIKYEIRTNPDKYPYIRTNFFNKSDTWARHQITQFLKHRFGVHRRTETRGTTAVYLFEGE